MFSQSMHALTWSEILSLYCTPYIFLFFIVQRERNIVQHNNNGQRYPSHIVATSAAIHMTFIGVVIHRKNLMGVVDALIRTP